MNVLWSLLGAAAISLLLTPGAKWLSYKVGAVDVPKDDRRMHQRPMPRLGGLAIVLGFMTAAGRLSRGVLLGAAIIVALGVFDDVVDLPARLKLTVQIIAALCAAVSNPAMWILSVLWIVAVTNAVNLIDGLDGLACGVSAIAAGAMLAIALWKGGTQAVPLAALLGACIGFLPYNLNPAKIFMGDTGATFLGFVLAALSLRGLSDFRTFAAAVLILGVPLFDMCVAILRRMAQGKNPMAPDRSHIHHRLIDLGLSQRQAVGVLYAVSTGFAFLALAWTMGGLLWLLLILEVLILLGLVGMRAYFLNRAKA